MKEILKLNIWIIILALGCWTFISYIAIEREGCVEADFSRQIFKAGVCKNKNNQTS